MIKDVEGLVKFITEKIKENMDVAVLGMSGGADSTLCSILCKLALGEKNVYSVHMPMNKLDEETFNSNSLDIANKLGLKIIKCPVKDISHAIVDSLEDCTGRRLSQVNAGNARSRARMTILYGISHALNERYQSHPEGSKRVRVMNTCNWSETYLGYDTKFGDATGDFAPIANLYKEEVYQFLEYFRDEGFIEEKHIDRTPSAGLWDGQTDEEELGMTYPEIDLCIKMLEGEIPLIENDNIKKVKKMYNNTTHKREPIPTIGVKEYRG